MGSIRRLCWVGLALLSAAGAAAQQPQPVQSARPARIPASAFASHPPLIHMRLSPKGTSALGLKYEGTHFKVVVANLAAKQSLGVPLPETWEFDDYWWAGEERVLIRLGRTMPFDLDEAYFTRLLVLDLKTQSFRMLGDKDLGPNGGDVDYIDPSGTWALVSMQRTRYEYPSVYRFDLATGKRELVTPSSLKVWQWYADSAGVVRFGVGEWNRDWFMLYRRSPDDPFVRLPGERFTQGDTRQFSLNPGSDEGFVLSNELTGRYALHRFNFATQTLGAAVYKSDSNDVGSYELDASGTTPLWVTYVDDRERTVWFEPLLKSYQRKIEQAYPDKLVRFYSWNDAWTRFLVWIGGDDDAGADYLFIPDQGKLERLVERSANLRDKPLARSRYVQYTARDGLEIPAYLTLPPGRDPKGLPLVILPHGGPYGVRDELGFDRDVQFLANRGYAVLRPNYRGSGGYGKAFHDRGKGQRGRAMQDDLDDGMDWLVKEGIVDPKRVCIFGASYGGYAALWGATRNPDRYRCAASLAGVTDVKRQIKYQVSNSTFRGGREWRSFNEGEDRLDFDTVAPLFQVDRLRVPVLFGHGGEDQVVPPKHSALYASALKRAGKTFEYYVYEGEGHGLRDAAHQQDWYERLDAFLAKYNPAD